MTQKGCWSFWSRVLQSFGALTSKTLSLLVLRIGQEGPLAPAQWDQKMCDVAGSQTKLRCKKKKKQLLRDTENEQKQS